MIVTRRAPRGHDRLSPRLCRLILDRLGMPVFVLRKMYASAAARRLLHTSCPNGNAGRELVAHGNRHRDVALALGIAPETTKKHLKLVFDKVGVLSRVQLANRFG